MFRQCSLLIPLVWFPLLNFVLPRNNMLPLFFFKWRSNQKVWPISSTIVSSSLLFGLFHQNTETNFIQHVFFRCKERTSGKIEMVIGSHGHSSSEINKLQSACVWRVVRWGEKIIRTKWCCPGSNWGPLVCKTNVITDYTTAPLWQ